MSDLILVWISSFLNFIPFTRYVIKICSLMQTTSCCTYMYTSIIVSGLLCVQFNLFSHIFFFIFLWRRQICIVFINFYIFTTYCIYVDFYYVKLPVNVKVVSNHYVIMTTPRKIYISISDLWLLTTKYMKLMLIVFVLLSGRCMNHINLI